MIDWQDIVQGYNDKNHTSYTEKEMWEALYPENTVFQLDEILGVNHMTIVERLYFNSIPVLSKGHRHPTYMDKFKAIPERELNALSTIEIAERIQIPISTVRVYQFLRRKDYQHNYSRRRENV